MIAFQKSLPRRTVLRGLGATLGLPLLDSMVPAFRASAVEFMELHRLYGEGWEGVCEMRALYQDQMGCAAAQESAKAGELA